MKPTKTVNLDDVYVKKPCIGTELSGRVNTIDLHINLNVVPRIEKLSTDISSIIDDIYKLSSEISGATGGDGLGLLVSTDPVDEDEDHANS